MHWHLQLYTRDNLAPKVRKVNQVNKVLAEILDQQDLQDQLVQEVQKEHMVGKDLVGKREPLDHR